ncbi:hypothetical protein EV426DRAFT_703049 [Tirmania nivea]|nr:hypothetical protein EV426DRAFT_703049 [Tirmania nivea]
MLGEQERRQSFTSSSVATPYSFGNISSNNWKYAGASSPRVSGGLVTKGQHGSQCAGGTPDPEPRIAEDDPALMINSREPTPARQTSHASAAVASLLWTKSCQLLQSNACFLVIRTGTPGFLQDTGDSHKHHLLKGRGWEIREMSGIIGRGPNDVTKLQRAGTGGIGGRNAAAELVPEDVTEEVFGTWGYRAYTEFHIPWRSWLDSSMLPDPASRSPSLAPSSVNMPPPWTSELTNIPSSKSTFYSIETGPLIAGDLAPQRFEAHTQGCIIRKLDAFPFRSGKSPTWSQASAPEEQFISSPATPGSSTPIQETSPNQPPLTSSTLDSPSPSSFKAKKKKQRKIFILNASSNSVRTRRWSYGVYDSDLLEGGESNPKGMGVVEEQHKQQDNDEGDVGEWETHRKDRDPTPELEVDDYSFQGDDWGYDEAGGWKRRGPTFAGSSRGGVR